MQRKSPIEYRNGYLNARASTEERMVADQLQRALGFKSQSALIRSLVNSKAAELGMI